MDSDALRGLTVRVSAHAFEAPLRTPADVVRLTRGLRHPVVLAGEWVAGEVVLAADPIALELGERDPFTVLGRQPTLTSPPAEGVIGGGWFGWLGFAQGSCALGFYPNVLCLRGGQWWDEALMGVIDDELLEERRRSLRDLVGGASPESMEYALGPVTPSRDRSGHVAAVERCIHAIRDGEVYQANICLTLEADVEGSAADLAADLIGGLAPPYGAFLELGDRTVASASPELFLRRAGSHVTSRPIKGTRPRSPQSSAAEAARLAGSVKDRAENVMIVDLVRNDLSRVAETGSVRVTQLLDVVAHPGVWHLVSSVEAQLRAGVADGELLRATFPPGSVTGAPKRRALEIIAELEDRPRGVYTGAIGYTSPAAGLELSVAIRTAEISAGRLSLGVGGGITVDSTPAEEWWECFDKAWPLLRAIGGVVSGSESRRSLRDPLGASGVCDTTLLWDGWPLERADHLARLQRSMYELYQRPLPEAAEDALLSGAPAGAGWERQRVDVTEDGTVTVVHAPAQAPRPVRDQPGAHAVVMESATGFGGHKWSDRRSQEALEAAHPGRIVLLGGRYGLLESTRANLVAVVDGRLVTAPLDGGILPGVTRAVLLDLARDLGVEIELRVPQPQESQALAVVSSVAGMRWIARCEGGKGQHGWHLTWEAPGELLCELSRRLVERWTDGDRARATVPK